MNMWANWIRRVCVCVCRTFDCAVEEWRQFHCNMNDLSQWLCDTEQALADETRPDGDPERARVQQEVSKRVQGQNWILKIEYIPPPKSRVLL